MILQRVSVNISSVAELSPVYCCLVYAELIDSETLQGRPGAVPFAVPMLSTRCALASIRDEH